MCAKKENKLQGISALETAQYFSLRNIAKHSLHNIVSNGLYRQVFSLDMLQVQFDLHLYRFLWLYIFPAIVRPPKPRRQQSEIVVVFFIQQKTYVIHWDIVNGVKHFACIQQRGAFLIDINNKIN